MKRTRLAPDQPTLTRRRLLVFPLIAIGLGLAPWLLLELSLRSLDLCRPQPSIDPFIAFSSVEPLFVLDKAARVYRTNPMRRLCFRDQQFPEVKLPSSRRVFVLGGSTVQGHPYSIETSFTTWLALALSELDHQNSWQVVNCGGISYATYRLAPLLDEIINYQPDLVILYTGHNEFLESRSYGTLQKLPSSLIRVLDQLARLRTFQLARQGVVYLASDQPRSLNESRTILPSEVDALLDYKGGLERYKRDPSWRTGVIRHFGLNLARMIDACQKRNVPIVLVNPVANLLTPPFKALPTPGLTPRKRHELARLQATALDRMSTSPAIAAELLRRATLIDHQNATLFYELGLAYQALEDQKKAVEAFEQARDLDLCPLRITNEMSQMIVRLATQKSVPLLDADILFRAHSAGGIPGPDWLVDHVHPSIRGHQLLADALLETLAKQRLAPAPAASWPGSRDSVYAAHLESLPPLYFHQAEVRLQNLEDWARGRAERARSRGSIADEIQHRRTQEKPSTQVAG